MMKSFVPAAIALLVPASALAAPSDRTFTRNGETYTYSTSLDAHGRTVITGTAANGAPFRYVVDGNRVDGTTDRRPVRFRTATPIPRADAGVTLAAN